VSATELAKGRRPAVVAARVRRRAHASAAVTAAYVKGTRALEAWCVRHGAAIMADPLAAVESMPIERLLGKPLLAAFVPAVGQLAAAATEKRLDPLTAAAYRLARDEGARLVVEVSATTRKAIRTVIADGIAKNRTIPEVRTILRQTVGLHSRYARAVINMRARLSAKGVSGPKLDKAVDKYKDKLLTARAYCIARTETAFAESRARYEAWEEQMSQGELDAKLERIWITGDPCPICAALGRSGSVPMGQPFVTIEGRSVMYPPVHPNCKCTLGLVRRDARAPLGSTSLVGQGPALQGRGVFARVAPE
jgi:hypothetical protein